MGIKRKHKCLVLDDSVEIIDDEKRPPPPPSLEFRYLDFDKADRTLMIIRM